MKCSTFLLTALLTCACVTSKAQAQNHIIPHSSSSSLLSGNMQRPGQPQISPNGHYLLTAEGEPLFLTCDTAWQLAIELNRQEVATYLDRRADQQFNAVALVAFPMNEIRSNAYGDEPFQRSNGAWNPAKPLTTPGSNPDDPTAYDHWDHLDYTIEAAAEHGFYVLLLPSWGKWVAGSYDGDDTSSIFFNEKNAYRYGRWLGNRYKDQEHIIWIVGGDRSAIYGEKDYRPVFRALAEGVADGVNGVNDHDGQADYSTTLMSYHPRKWAPNSSHWFHNDEWLDFNSVQDAPYDQLSSITKDFSRLPLKPTWLLEGRYEDANKAGYGPDEWGAWQMRFQAYQTVFAGGLGHTYGHRKIWGFTEGWQEALRDTGALDMQHLLALMNTLSTAQYLNRIPDQGLIAGDPGRADTVSSTRIQATRGSAGTYAMIYSANGRDIPVKMNRLSGPSMEGYWFNPRTGRWRIDDNEYRRQRPFERSIKSGPGADVHTFDPPGTAGEDNDWVLVLTKEDDNV